MRRSFPWMLLLLVACAPKYLPNTEVEDTPANRAVAEVVERYRVAVEQRDLETLRALVSRRYFSNAGTTAEPSDDYGYAQLEERVLPLLRENVKSVQFVIYLRRISFPSETTAQADFEYYYKFFYIEGGKDRWQARNDFARLELVKEDGVWRIVSGL